MNAALGGLVVGAVAVSGLFIFTDGRPAAPLTPGPDAAIVRIAAGGAYLPSPNDEPAAGPHAGPPRPRMPDAGPGGPGTDGVVAAGDGLPAAAVPPEAAPTEAVPAEAAPAEAVPAEAVPAEAVPAEAVPAEAVPAEAVPAEGRRTRARPRRWPAQKRRKAELLVQPLPMDRP